MVDQNIRTSIVEVETPFKITESFLPSAKIIKKLSQQ